MAKGPQILYKSWAWEKQQEAGMIRKKYYIKKERKGQVREKIISSVV